MRPAINSGSICNDESLIGYVCAKSGFGGMYWCNLDFSGMYWCHQGGVLLLGKEIVFD